MKFKKVLSVVMAATLSLSVLASCGSDTTSETTPETQTTSESTEPDAVQELNLILNDPKTLDVNDVRNANEFQVLSQVQEGLFRVFTDENGQDVIEYAGAESHTVSEDGLVYTFTLRDHNWSDGQPVTAQNYVDSIIRLLTPENAFAYSFMAYDIKGATEFYDGTGTAEEVGVKALDDKTLEITLAAPIPFFEKKLTNVCFYPVRLDVIEAAGDDYLYDYTKHVFNGPFVIESRITDNELVLAKNPTYWDAENVTLEKVTFKQVAEQATQSTLLDNDEVDVVTATSDYYDLWKQKADAGELVNYEKTSPSVTYMVFNQHTGGLSGLMNNEKIRKALSLSIDREEYNELIFNGLNTPAYGLIPDSISVGDENYRSLNPDVLQDDLAEYDTDEELKALFEEGLAEVDPNKAIEDVSLVLFELDPTSESKAAMEYFQQTWESTFGINIDIQVYSDRSLFIDARDNNQYDLIMMGWNGDYDDPMTFFELFNTGSGYAKFMGGYSNEEYDVLFDSLATEPNNDVRKETYVEMEENLIEDYAGIAPLTFTETQIFTQPYVKDLSLPTFGNLEFSRAYISGK